MKRLALGLILLAALDVRPASAWTFDWAGHVAVDAEGLQSDDPAKRHEAVIELAKYDITLTQPYLMKALGDDDEKVSHAAAKALGQGGALTAVSAMIDWLGAADPRTRAVAAEALGDIGGTEATAALTRSLGDVDAAVRQRAVKALGTIGKKGNPSVVIALIPRLEDDKPDVKNATIIQLEELGDRRAVIPLVAKFSETGRETRRLAVRAVGKLGDPSAVPALIRLINDPDEEVRTAAVAALGTLGAVDAIDALTEQLSTGIDAYRAKVAYSLGQIAATPQAGKAGEDAMRTLVINLSQSQLRNGSREALRVAGKAAVPALVAHLQGRIAGDPASAVTLLAESGDPRATATLAAELERGRVAMPLVLKALGATGDPAALVPVLGALSSKDAAIRLAAMEALRPLIGSDGRAGDVLIEHLADEDLEIRVLAAEYLGLLRVGAASAKLTALAGPGNPTRLRRAAIDALGEIGRPEATKTLLAVLREGPTELHRSAATALSYLGDPSAVAALSSQAQTDRGPTRHEVVRALGATLRGRPDPGSRKLLRQLTQDGSIKVSLAAIAGLAAAADPEDAPFLRTMVENAASDRRRAAAWALGEMRDVGSINVLSTAMSIKDDRLVGDSAWALGEILATHPGDKRAAATVERWLYVGKHGGWAGSVNGAAALSRLLWAVPREARTALLSGSKRGALTGLVFHRSRLVRINVAHALGSLSGDDDAAKALAQMLRDDPSPQVRIAAARNLARAGGARVGPALKAALDGDLDLRVKTAAKAAQGPVSAPAARSEWRIFYVVDPSADDAPVRQEQYFVHTPDGVVWASYTDARGELTSEHVPPGDAIVWPASREAEY
ncbi:MAG: HEAT repeat domain-containing protein [Deltaproteobacteria bacterium]|nr:HEAT repeat domain-containing protein [Deltaproteobacteria bacterium]